MSGPGNVRKCPEMFREMSRKIPVIFREISLALARLWSRFALYFNPPDAPDLRLCPFGLLACLYEPAVHPGSPIKGNRKLIGLHKTLYLLRTPRGSEKFWGFLLFFSVILVPELFRKLGETPGIHFHQVSSKSEHLGTSYEQKSEKI